MWKVEKNCTVSENEPRTISSTRKTSMAAKSTVASAEPAVRKKGQRGFSLKVGWEGAEPESGRAGSESVNASLHVWSHRPHAPRHATVIQSSHKLGRAEEK
jgi:hypothetical protein